MRARNIEEGERLGSVDSNKSISKLDDDEPYDPEEMKELDEWIEKLEREDLKKTDTKKSDAGKNTKEK
jgi:hypothetical protein